MIEYTIYIRNGSCPEFNALPFYYNSFQEVMVKLQELICLEEKRHRPYYVENKFYENKHSYNYSGKLFIIKSRNVSNWEVCEDNCMENKTKEKTNIKYINNYLKNLNNY